MARNNDNSQAMEQREEEPVPDFWSDEGARRFNEALDEGEAYARAHGGFCGDPEDYREDQDCEYRDPDLCDPEEETLSPRDLELIMENSYIM